MVRWFERRSKRRWMFFSEGAFSLSEEAFPPSEEAFPPSEGAFPLSDGGFTTQTVLIRLFDCSMVRLFDSSIIRWFADSFHFLLLLPSFSEAVFQRSGPSAKRSFSAAVFQRSDPSAKRSFSKAVFLPQLLPIKKPGPTMIRVFAILNGIILRCVPLRSFCALHPEWCRTVPALR